MSKMLVIDDDTEVVNLLTWLLEDEGHDVEGVTSSAEAVQRVRQELPDLVLLDLMMPQISGSTICREIKADEATKNVHVIFLSGHGRLEKETADAGADGYLWKPFDLDTLVDRVNQLTHRLPDDGTMAEGFEKQAD